MLHNQFYHECIHIFFYFLIHELTFFWLIFTTVYLLCMLHQISGTGHLALLALFEGKSVVRPSKIDYDDERIVRSHGICLLPFVHGSLCSGPE